MARRSKRRKTHAVRRRRVGAISAGSSQTIQLLLGSVVGGIGKRLIDNVIAKQTVATLSPKVLNLVEMAAGGFLAYKMTNPFIKGIGFGLAATAATGELQAMGVLTGIMGRIDPASLYFPNRRNGVGYSQTKLPTVGAPGMALNLETVGSTYANVYDR